MKFLLLAALVSLQLLASAQADNTPPATPSPRPLYFDYVTQHPNRRYARNIDEDFQAFFRREVSPVIQDEIHKATQEVMHNNGRLHEDEEHDRYGRSVNPFQPPPPPKRPIITDDIRGANRRWARDTLLNEHLKAELHRERRDQQLRLHEDEEHDRYVRSVNPFQPPPPPKRPIITDDIRGANRRWARDTLLNEHLKAELHRERRDLQLRLHEDEEHDRYGRSVNPFQPPPPPKRPIITDDIRGANRRWARDTLLNEHLKAELHRERRDLQLPGYKKPTHYDVIIPNWNPNARTQPWQTISARNRRS